MTSKSQRAETREALHSVAEWLLAGPQYERSGTIRLQVTDSGIVTKDGHAAIEGTELVVGSGDQTRRVAIKGTIAQLGAATCVQPQVPTDLYNDHSPLGPTAPVHVDPSAAAGLMEWFRRGDQGLRHFAPAEEPVLWPEHFDLGISQGEVNYGISLGDSAYDDPYAYVGPWQVPEGDFWNAPFGAVRAASELASATDIAAFFVEGTRMRGDVRL